MPFRDEKVASTIKDLASNFIASRGLGEPGSLVTVTRVLLNDSLSHGEVFVTMYPVAVEVRTLNNLKRAQGAFRSYIKKHLRIRAVPYLEFMIESNV